LVRGLCVYQRSSGSFGEEEEEEEEEEEDCVD
jgi:hypothetical protein